MNLTPAHRGGGPLAGLLVDLTRALAGPHHPQLVVLSTTGFGPDGPRAGGPGMTRPPLRFFHADGNETARTAHHAPPTFDEHGARIPAEAGARDPMRGES